MNMVITKTVEIDATGLYYRELNLKIRDAIGEGATNIVLKNVVGQRYIGTNLHGIADNSALKNVTIDIYGTPGNDLGAFLNGPTIRVFGNVMDGSGNTMNEGRIIAYGRAGDLTGFAARGGELFIQGNAGYRVGIHMKEYEGKKPMMIIGGTTQDFLGEYMAGGVIIVMGIDMGDNRLHSSSHVGTGMHGGKIFIRGSLSKYQLGGGVGAFELNKDDIDTLSKYISEYGKLFNYDVSDIKPEDFTKLTATSLRPYKNMYAY
ncbi:MAG: hypothetical protein SNJ70_07600 [Armatimonadota bacterium]